MATDGLAVRPTPGTLRAERVARLVDGLRMHQSTVLRFAGLVAQEQVGWRLFQAYAASQRHAQIADRLRRHGVSVDADDDIPPTVLASMARAMGRVAGRVAALKSIAQERDLPSVRKALGLSTKQSDSKAREREALLVRGLELSLTRMVRRANDAANAKLPDRVGLRAIAEAVALGFGCHPTTVERAWRNAGRDKSKLHADAEAVWDRVRAIARGVPTAAAIERRSQSRKAGKAAIDRDMRKSHR